MQKGTQVQKVDLPEISPKYAFPLSFYRQDTFKVSYELLGSILATNINGKITAGIITEVEPYMGSFDKASHAYKNKKTPRTAIQFEPGGYTYIFFVYGMYHQFCVVTNKKNIPDAILVRSVMPIYGLKTMAYRRYKQKLDISNNLSLQLNHKPKKQIINLSNGPGKLAIALGISKKLNAKKLTSPQIWIQPFLNIKRSQIASAKRIGIDYAEEYAHKPWRFYIKQPPFVWWVSKV